MDIANIRLSSNAFFYKLKEGSVFSEPEIERMLRDTTADKVHHYALDICRQSRPNGSRFSIRVFKNAPNKPSFFVNDEDGWKEQKIGYFLFVEYLNYVAVLRRYCTIPKSALDKMEEVDYSTLISLHSQEGTAYHKVSMQNLDGSDYALRNKSYEGLNLKNNVSSVAANRYFVRTVKGSNGHDKFALNLYSSRINEFSDELSVQDICEWVKNVVDRIITVNPTSGDFLSIFAIPEKFSNISDQLEPKSLLVFYSLLFDLVDDPNVSFSYSKLDGNIKVMTKREILYYISLISKAYTKIHVIDEGDGNLRYFADQNQKIEIAKRKHDIVLKNKTWNRLLVSGSQDGVYDGTLSDLINDNNQFNVYFTNSSLVYSNRKLFRDSKLLNSIPQLLKVFVPWDELSQTTCEKYPDGTDLQTLSHWDNNSIFKVVEERLPTLGYDLIICDDCKKEWADHIAINNESVCFFAEKWKNSKNSASDFQDVIGQALKNLGNMTPSSNSLSNKRQDWIGSYRTSRMTRFRSPQGSVDEAINIWTENVSGPGFRREMAIVVNFISKTDFEQDLMAIHSGQHPRYEEEAMQRLWLLSTFVNSCMEIGVYPKIYCVS